MKPTETGLMKINCKCCKKELNFKINYSYRKALQNEMYLCNQCNQLKAGIKKVLKIEKPSIWMIRKFFITSTKKIRKCPKCKNKIFYSNRTNAITSEHRKLNCRKCSGILMRGIKLSDKTIEKLRKINIGKRYSKEVNMSKASYGKNNGMYGRSVLDVWKEKYGEEKANKMWEERSKAASIKSSGSNNPMYGKPSPQGSGNGWSGWYKGWFFRSIRELSYVIIIIERFNMNWVSGEKGFNIKYKNFDGTERNYFPDFVINNKYVVEIKPKKLWNSDWVIRKKEAALKYCKENNLIYKLTDLKSLNFEKMKKLYELGIIKFIDRYDKKMKEWIKQNERNNSKNRRFV
jgi:hypothetical protein